MENSMHVSDSSETSKLMASTTRLARKGHFVASVPKAFSDKALRCVSLMRNSVLGSGVVGDIGVFLLTTAALEVVRRISKAKCPFIWRGLEALQLLAYPPFKWIQRWSPFRGLVKNMQALSRPMLVLSIATIFSEEYPGYDSFDSQENSEPQTEPPSELSTRDTRSGDETSRSIVSKKWLLDLQTELDKHGLTLPERLDEDELCRFRAASNGDFSRFVLSVKKTIQWRQTYTILSPQELKEWSRFVFWHGYDVRLRPCLIIRLGLACSNLNSSNKPLFAKAVVSQIEYGVMNLVDKKHPQITVLMDCKGLSPFGFPMQMMRSCAILLQDHYPRRLACLAVIRLPAVARVITQTLFQVLKPATRKKLRVLGDNYLEFVSELFQTLPVFLGGACSCPDCLYLSNIQDGNVEIMQTGPRAEFGNGGNEEITQTGPRAELGNDRSEEISQTSPRMDHGNDDVSSAHFYYYPSSSMSMSSEQVFRTVIIGVLVLWIFGALIWGVRHVESPPFW